MLADKGCAEIFALLIRLRAKLCELMEINVEMIGEEEGMF